MKHWIAKQLIGISEITGWAVPAWVRRLVDADTYERLVHEEQSLTQALRSRQEETHELPPFLKSRLDRALEAAEEEDAVSARPHVIRPAWALAAAAVLVAAVSLFVLTNPGERSPAAAQVASQSSNTSIETPAASADPNPVPPEPTRDFLQNDLILQPLALEQARLAADMTNAVRFVAESFLPSAYARQVDDNLTTLKQEFLKSI